MGGSAFREACCDDRCGKFSQGVFLLASLGCDLDLGTELTDDVELDSDYMSWPDFFTIHKETVLMAENALAGLAASRQALLKLFPEALTEELLQFVYHEPNLHALVQM